MISINPFLFNLGAGMVKSGGIGSSKGAMIHRSGCIAKAIQPVLRRIIHGGVLQARLMN